jgi:peptidase inhibitor family I36
MRRMIGVLMATLVALVALAAGQAQATPAAHVATVAKAAAAHPSGKVSAQYTSYNGKCEAGEVCLYYNSGCKGSMADFGGNVPDFQGYVFLSTGAGKGQPVKNNAASANNHDASWTARIWFNSGYHGSYDNIGPNAGCRQLVNTYNENASLSWYLA